MSRTQAGGVLVALRLTPTRGYAGRPRRARDAVLPAALGEWHGIPVAAESTQPDGTRTTEMETL